jgi:hypothetical protein
MMSGALHRRNRKDQAKARPLQKIVQKIETTAIADEIAESLIDTFPASDPPAWIPLPVSALPNGQGDLAPCEESSTSD